MGNSPRGRILDHFWKNERINLLPYYQEYAEKELIVNTYDIHPNELGHQLAAQAIYETLNEEKYIKQ